MSRVVKIASTLRTHWKKSTLAFTLALYGAHKVNDKLEENAMMTAYCREAQSHGESIDPTPYHVTVILNPASDGARGRTKYERYCEPLLHLAGFKVSAVRTEAQGQAKEIAESIERGCDAVLLAGGDGTVMEAVTGLLRRTDADNNFVVGILPIGTDNYTARRLFPDLSDVKLMAEAAMAVIRQRSKPVDVMEVKNVSQNAPFSGKKIHCMRQLQMGCLVDSKNRVDRYWYLPWIKHYLTYIFSFYSSSDNILRHCSGSFSLADSSSGIKEAPSLKQEEGRSGSLWSYVFPSSSSSATGQVHLVDNGQHEQSLSWNSDSSSSSGIEEALSLKQEEGRSGSLWAYIFPSYSSSATGQVHAVDNGQHEPSLTWNPDCKTSASELVLQLPSNASAGLDLYMGPDSAMTLSDFVREGWRRQNEIKASDFCPNSEWKLAGNLDGFRWSPSFESESEEDEKTFYMDNEPIEIKGPIEVTVLNGRLRMFCADELHVPPVKGKGEVNSDNLKTWLRQQKMQQASVAKRLF